MTISDLKILAEACYQDTVLDEKKVIDFASHMTRKMLKAFIRQLKEIEKKHNVIIALPNVKSYNTNRKSFEEIFAGKEISVVEDKTLLSGIRVQSNDIIFERSLNNTFETFKNDIEKHYE